MHLLLLLSHPSFLYLLFVNRIYDLSSSSSYLSLSLYLYLSLSLLSLFSLSDGQHRWASNADAGRPRGFLSSNHSQSQPSSLTPYRGFGTLHAVDLLPEGYSSLSFFVHVLKLQLFHFNDLKCLLICECYFNFYMNFILIFV